MLPLSRQLCYYIPVIENVTEKDSDKVFGIVTE